MHQEQEFDIVIIGGGAAGLMAALTAGNRGKRVVVLEASNKLGKKILMSGGGRCNFTNLEVDADNFICDNPHFVKSALAQYSQWDFIGLVAKHGVEYHEKSHGQLFCDHSSKDILNLLVKECETSGVEFRLNAEISDVACRNHYVVETNFGGFKSSSLIVATGGLSIPSLGGATGLGYRLAQQFSLTVNATEASLVPFTLSGKWHEFAASLSGVSIPIRVSVPAQSFRENLLFTHRGLSGPAVLQISNYWGLGDDIEIDLLPNVDVADLLVKSKAECPQKTISAILQNYFPKSFIAALQIEWWGEFADKALQEVKTGVLSALGQKINCWTLKPSGTEGYRTAEVTRGGVRVDGLSSKTLQVNDHPGLFFIGEVLDVTGHLGGYNFQWAWSSGYVAGLNA